MAYIDLLANELVNQNNIELYEPVGEEENHCKDLLKFAG